MLPLILLAVLPALSQQTTPAPEPAAPAAAAAPDTPAATPVREQGATVAEGRFPQGTLRFRIPLRQLIGLEGTIMLRNDRAIYTVFVPVAARYQVLRCRLHLAYTNSISLIPERSSLSVLMNDVILQQMRLDPLFPSNTVTVDIPNRLMRNDFNRLQFSVAQRSVHKCQDPNAAELYTQIDPDASYLEAEMLPVSVPTRLSALRDIIDEKLWYPYPFHLCFPESGSREDSVLSWGSILTQGIGLALGTQPFRVTHAEALRPGMDNIVVGPMNSLTRFLTATEIGAITGSFLAVKPMPDDPKHYMIIVSGRNDEEVGQAALALSLINYPLPDSQYALVNRLALPDQTAYIRNSPITKAGSYAFKRLGLRTSTIKGFNTGSFEIPIYMPGDLSMNDMSNFELRLNFAYGAATREDSTVGFFVNDIFHQAIHLRQVEGARHNGHKIFLPTRGFMPGRNVVRISPVMVPYYTDECELDQMENLLFTLYDDSTLVLPSLARGAILPSLGLLSQTGFPYTASADGVEAAVYLTTREPDNRNAAWTLLGKIAQISGALLHRAEVSYRLSRSNRNLLVVGPVNALPDDVVQGLPTSPREEGFYRYLLSANPSPGSALPTGLQEFINNLRGVEAESAVILETPTVAEMNARADLVDNIIIIQGESPIQRGYANTIVTAADSARLLAGMNVLQEREFWNNLVGDLAVWNMEPDSLSTTKVGTDFTYGASSIVARATEGLGRQPVVFAVVIILALALVGYLARLVLNQRRSQHAKDGGPDKSQGPG